MMKLDTDSLKLDMRLSDYIERRQKDLVFKQIVETVEDMQKTVMETPKPNQGNIMNKECLVETKDKVEIIPGQASKFDSGKPRMDLLPMRPLKDVAEVLTYGALKYGSDNWREGKPIAHSRHFAGIQRHLMAYWSGEDKDPETGFSHLAHAACGILMFLELSQSHPNLDDRCKSALKWNDE